jgi:hypothetical protein
MNTKARPCRGKTPWLRGFSPMLRAPFDTDGERRVSERKPGMVSKWWMRQMHASHHTREARQLKIYGESKEPNFLRIFSALSPMQSLAIYRGLLVGSIAGSIATGSEKAGRGMFFLLRMAFWLGLVLVLLPRDKTPESEKLPQVGASEAVQAATAAVSDMSQFCKRQPAACEVGGQAATVIGQRAQQGARKLYQIITDKKSPDHTSSIGGNEDVGASLAGMAPRDTLTVDDLNAEWHVPPAP